MRRFQAVTGSLVFFAVAPGTILGYLPWAITRWQTLPAPFEQEWIRIAGVALVAAGLVPLIGSFARFALEGLGTPAPIAPPENLVVGGFYRHVRNPMYVGLIVAILGEAALFCDPRLLAYAATVWLSFHLFVTLYEEPALASTFGAEYDAYRAEVPRWLPRPTAWRPAG